MAVKQKGRRHEKWKPVYRIPKDAIQGLFELLTKWKAWQKKWKLAGPSESFWRLPMEGPHTKSFSASKHGTAWTRLALAAVGAEPPPDFKFDGHGSRSGAATGASAVGVALPRICFMGNWSIRSAVVHDYIDPTAPATPGAFRFFGWLVPSLSNGKMLG